MKFQNRDGGLYLLNPEGDDRWIAPSIYVDARTHDLNGEHYGNLVRFRDPENHERSCILLFSELMEGKEAIQRMADLGFRPSTRRKDIEALRDYLLNANPPTTVCSVPSHGWHDGQFIDGSEFDISQHEGQRVTILDPNVATGHRYNTAGSLRDWQDSVGRLCAGNSRLVFTLSAAFAAALLEPTLHPNIGIHLRGISSIGKTTALYAAGSVWGGGGGAGNNLGFVQSWRATANGLELACAQANDSLLCLDEISLVNDREIGDIVYALGNGIGKRRATRDIRSRPVIQFRLVFLSCGERSLQEMMASAGKRSRGGQESRLIDIPADAGQGRGIFETLHEHAKGSTLSQCLSQAAKTYYGTPARTFTRYLADNRKDIIAEAKELQVRFLSQLKLPESAAGEVYRVAGAVALIAAAGEIATRLGITGWDPAEHLPTWASHTCFHAWRFETRGDSFDAYDVQAGLKGLAYFLARYAYRFQSIKNPPANLPDRAGFWEDDPEASYPDTDGEMITVRRYYIIREVFINEICGSIDHQLVLDALSKHDLLVTNDGQKWTYQKRVPGEGKDRYFTVLSTVCGKF